MSEFTMLEIVEDVASSGCPFTFTAYEAQELLGEVKAIALERDKLKAENERLRKLVEARDKLLVAYRLGGRPSDKTLEDIRRLRD